MTRRRIRVSTGRSSPAFHRSITTISFRSTALNAYLEVISDNWRFAIVISRSNMVFRAKSLGLFTGITPASFCHSSISALVPSSFFSCLSLFVKFSLSVFILPVSPPLRVSLYEVPPHKNHIIYTAISNSGIHQKSTKSRTSDDATLFLGNREGTTRSHKSFQWFIIRFLKILQEMIFQKKEVSLFLR